MALPRALARRCGRLRRAKNLLARPANRLEFVPRFQTKSIPTTTPNKVAGMATNKMSASLVPVGPNTLSIAAAAAETGLAVIAMCDAVTLMLIARSGLILFFIATSAMMGMMEYEM